MSPFSEGTKVKWTTSKGVHGSGRIIAPAPHFEANSRHWLVAVDAEPGEEHRVIYCAETWLEVIT